MHMYICILHFQDFRATAVAIKQNFFTSDPRTRAAYRCSTNHVRDSRSKQSGYLALISIFYASQSLSRVRSRTSISVIKYI